jgi:protoporphyrinogen/coproporphyrinogen III oxidase
MLQVTVIGSGAAGLAAGFRLQQAGHRVRMLERSDRLGSKLRSTRRDGFLLDQGALFIDGGHTRMLRIIEEAGLLDQVVPPTGGIATLRDGEVHRIGREHVLRDLRKTKLLSPGAKLHLARLIPELARARRRVSFEHAHRLGAYDGQTAEEWSRRLGDEVMDYVVGPALRQRFTAAPDARSRVDLLAAMRLLGARLATLRDGMSVYPERLAERFDTRLGAEAVAVREEAGGVWVSWRDGGGTELTEQTDGVVLAVPAREARQLLAGLDDWRREVLEAVEEGPVISANIAVDRAPAGLEASLIQVPRPVHADLASIVLDHHRGGRRTPPDRGLLTVTAIGEFSRRHLDDDDQTVAAQLLDAVHAILPGVLGNVQFVGVNRWHQQVNPVGHYRALARFREASEGDLRVQLAGDFLAPQSLESATAAGERAARRLLSALSHHREQRTERVAAMRRAAARAGPLPRHQSATPAREP